MRLRSVPGATGLIALIAVAVLDLPAQAASINFDDANNASVVNTRYAALAVTFSNPLGGSVYARSNPANASAPNVVSVLQTGVPAFNALYGAVDATFTTLQKTVSIDAAALRTPESLGTPVNRPFLEAYDSSNLLLGRVLFQGTLPGAGGVTPFETLTFTSATANIKRVRFSSQQTQPGPSVFGLFDNLSFGAGEFVYDEFVPKEWNISRAGTGTSVVESKQALQVTLLATAANGPDGYFSAGYVSTCKLTGDFDLRTEFSAVTFPPQNGARLGLTIPGVATAERVSWGAADVGPPGDYFAANVAGLIWAAPTTAKSGRLRLTRAGDVVSSFYATGTSGAWQLLASGLATTADVHFAVSAWSDDTVFANQKVVVKFDNVVLASGQLTGDRCPFR